MGREGFGGVELHFIYDTPSLSNFAKWCSRVAMPMWVRSLNQIPPQYESRQSENDPYSAVQP